MDFDQSNRIEIRGNDVPQNIALVFATALLFVLCQPRRQDRDGNTVLSTRTRKKKRFQGESIDFILAAGYLVPTPCCSFVNNNCGGGDSGDSGNGAGCCGVAGEGGGDGGGDGGGGCGGCDGCGGGG